MNYVSLIIFFFIGMTSCQEKNTQSPKNSEITSIETGNEELSITLLEDNFHLVIIESEETILNNLKENIEKTEALGLTEDKKLEEGEVALIGTIAASFSVALGAIVGLSIHKSLQKNKSREDLYAPSLKPIDLSSSKSLDPKTIELPEEIATSLSLKKNITEKELAKNTLDKLDQGKSLAFNSKDAADNVQKFLEQKFSLTEKEMRVIEVNGRFHLVSWQKIFTAKDKPFLVMEVKTDFAKISNDLAEQVKTKDYVLVVNPKNTKDVENIKNFINSNKENILAQKQTSKTPDGKDIYVFTNKELQKNLDEIKKLTLENEKINLEKILLERREKDSDGNEKIFNDRAQVRGALGEIIKTRTKNLASFQRLNKTYDAYLRKNIFAKTKDFNLVSKLKNLTDRIIKKLEENVSALNQGNSIEFIPDTKGNLTLKTGDLTQKELYALQTHAIDPELLKLYNESTILSKKESLEQSTDLSEALNLLSENHNTYKIDIGDLFQASMRADMPIQPLAKLPLKSNWFKKATEAVKLLTDFTNKAE